MPLSDRDCRVIRQLADGYSFLQACHDEGMTLKARQNLRTRLLKALDLDDITQIRLWASPITNEELSRLCGRRNHQLKVVEDKLA